ncbi:unnamed protein product [Sphenostylis stenocarpa]|uniref:Uncharacterized protein n=1 Tax=Sphenostylis stenocarpa TaxID=92480 RepID=A0AA86W4E3_9FABA|nr:unnamed protein product [Sphenostylis stenocarpa]
MIVLHPFAFLPSCTTITCSKPFSHDKHFVPSSTPLRIVPNNARTKTFFCSAKSQNAMDFNIDIIKEDLELQGNVEGGLLAQGMYPRSDEKDIDEEEAQEGEDDDDGYSDQGPHTENPQEAQSLLEDRLEKKRSKILHTRTGSGKPMKVSFNKTWFEVKLEFKDASLDAKIKLLLCDQLNMSLNSEPATLHMLGYGCVARNLHHHTFV